MARSTTTRAGPSQSQRPTQTQKTRGSRQVAEHVSSEEEPGDEEEDQEMGEGNDVGFFKKKLNICFADLSNIGRVPECQRPRPARVIYGIQKRPFETRGYQQKGYFYLRLCVGNKF